MDYGSSILARRPLANRDGVDAMAKCGEKHGLAWWSPQISVPVIPRAMTTTFQSESWLRLVSTGHVDPNKEAPWSILLNHRC